MFFKSTTRLHGNRVKNWNTDNAHLGADYEWVCLNHLYDLEIEKSNNIIFALWQLGMAPTNPRDPELHGY